MSVNDAFFDFASSNTKEVLRFAYVDQRQQQPLCDTLLKKEDVRPPQVRVSYRTLYFQSDFDLVLVFVFAACFYSMSDCVYLTVRPEWLPGDHFGEAERLRKGAVPDSDGRLEWQ